MGYVKVLIGLYVIVALLTHIDRFDIILCILWHSTLIPYNDLGLQATGPVQQRIVLAREHVEAGDQVAALPGAFAVQIDVQLKNIGYQRVYIYI